MSDNLAEKVLNENILVHALENREYLHRHPEQTNFFQRSHLTETINRVVDLLPDNSSKVLDLGCGTGYLFLEFLKKEFEVTGIDLSPEMISALEEKIPTNLKSKANLINSNALDYLEEKRNVFSLVTMSAFLHHLFDYKPVLRSACSALQKGGALLIFFEPLSQPVKKDLRFFSHNLLKGIDEKIYKAIMSLKNIAIPDEKYTFSDYQRQFGGIAINDVRSILESENLNIKIQLISGSIR